MEDRNPSSCDRLGSSIGFDDSVFHLCYDQIRLSDIIQGLIRLRYCNIFGGNTILLLFICVVFIHFMAYQGLLWQRFCYGVDLS
jgi:hypothetical protein